MTKAGLIERPRRGCYRISDAGRSVLQSGKLLDWPGVQAFPEYIVWKRASGRSASEAVVQIDGVGSAFHEHPAPPAAALASTPPEVMDAAFAQLQAGLAEDLLERVLTLTPTRFERLIVDLLIAMGYGDGRAEMGQAIGKSGDGGIDGVVNEDKLGLDAVYIQAKRYAPENSIGRSALQAFIGSMTGESASKGVFVTTSSFSGEARDYVRRVGQRVVLIDGARLARLMIDHGVGLRVDKTYVLRSIDANFFDVT